MAKVFYAVYGINGVGVYDDYEKVCESHQYLSQFHCKKFKSFLSARFHAWDGYNMLQELDDPDAMLQDRDRSKIKYNYLLFRKQIIKMNQ